MHPHLLLLLPWIVALVDGREFRPVLSSSVTKKDNYYAEGDSPKFVPCQGDRLAFRGEHVVATIDRDIFISEIQFPPLGIIYFGEDVTIKQEKTVGAENSDWQCPRRINRTVALYNVEQSQGSLWNHSMWNKPRDDTKKTPEGWKDLHMNLVPSEKDTVLFDDLIALQLHAGNFTVRKWDDNSYKRSFTTESLTERLRTIEGQIQLRLDRQMYREYDTHGVQTNRPIGNPITISQRPGSYKQQLFGEKNPNGMNETKAKICQYVRCEEEKMPRKCIKPVNPYGHCCPVCGALLTIQTYSLARTELVNRLERSKDAWNKDNKPKKLDEVYGVSIERTDDSDYEIVYEVLIYPLDTTSVFDEELMHETALAIREAIHAGHENNERGYVIQNYEVSNRDNTFDTSSIVLGLIFFSLSATIAIFLYNPQLKLHVILLARRSRAAVDEAVARATGKAPAEFEMSMQLVGGQDESSELEVETSTGSAAKFGVSEDNSMSFTNKIFRLGGDSFSEDEEPVETAPESDSASITTTETLIDNVNEQREEMNDIEL